MKGLILNAMHRKREAYASARKGIRHDLTSHISKCPENKEIIFSFPLHYFLFKINIKFLFVLAWHVLGILHRTDRNYAEATVCFKNAIRFDKVLFNSYIFTREGIFNRDLRLGQPTNFARLGHGPGSIARL